MRYSFWLVPSCVGLTVFAANGIAQNARSTGSDRGQLAAVTAGEKTTPAKTARQPVNQIVITPDREAAAIAFAKTHHAELGRLLPRLKRRSKTQYERAIRELYRVSDRLGRLHQANPRRYETSLKLWQLESRIRLMAAKMTMSNGSRLEAQLKALIQERQDVRLKQLEEDRDRTQARLDRLNQSIDKITRDREAAAENELARLKKSLGPYKIKNRKPTKRPAKRSSSSRNKQPSSKSTRGKKNPPRGSNNSSTSNKQSKPKSGQ